MHPQSRITYILQTIDTILRIFRLFNLTFPRTATIKESDPCNPSPCGSNSQCRTVNEHAVCTCLANFIGTPPNCRPECVVNSECSRELACIDKRCRSPCVNSCGINTQCKVINHSPICICNIGYTGDPFIKCFPAPRKNISVDIRLIIDHQILQSFNCEF